MRTLIKPTLVDIGTVVRKGGQAYNLQALRFGTHYRVLIARKAGVHTAAGDFSTHQEYEDWKANARLALRKGEQFPLSAN